ncbi:uncharacterized protein B0I36DRAFT_235427 [Microdochium trichocladiopsis]|uniref:Ketoreductase domain-containing protein n=1 Tax=Microdochium trichocladiopsis TaxID=1682393 RepID=A0A9P8YGI7_9PEZI|nr:uncharacterized protein B0I36DRAFT_235427 [Microdochium trichocladiopsis]KAH7039979.1 hypothetical protein B0I36DRAFT_235427 [Microdochium trichocladiopsis]
MYSLAGKRCLVTGGSRGIGLAIAQHFAREGAILTLVGRNTDTLTDALGTLSPAQHVGSAADSQEAKHSFLDFDTPAPYGYDILVNAAGVSQNSLLSSTSADDVQALLDINLRGTILGCQAVLPRMTRRKSGVIVNVSSLLATKGGKGASVYAASKAGIIGLTRSLTAEVGRFGIRVNVLLPGYINTEMTKDQISSQIPLGRLGRVEEVADAAAFLAKNPYAHNCVLNIDGGLSGV